MAEEESPWRWLLKFSPFELEPWWFNNLWCPSLSLLFTSIFSLSTSLFTSLYMSISLSLTLYLFAFLNPFCSISLLPVSLYLSLPFSTSLYLSLPFFTSLSTSFLLSLLLFTPLARFISVCLALPLSISLSLPFSQKISLHLSHLLSLYFDFFPLSTSFSCRHSHLYILTHKPFVHSAWRALYLLSSVHFINKNNLNLFSSN